MNEYLAIDIGEHLCIGSLHELFNCRVAECFPGKWRWCLIEQVYQGVKCKVIWAVPKIGYCAIQERFYSNIASYTWKLWKVDSVFITSPTCLRECWDGINVLPEKQMLSLSKLFNRNVWRALDYKCQKHCVLATRRVSWSNLGFLLTNSCYVLNTVVLLGIHSRKHVPFV